MKVTALIPETLIKEIKSYTQANTITQALVIVLSEWLENKKIAQLTEHLKVAPLKFSKGFSAQKIRGLNRNR